MSNHPSHPLYPAIIQTHNDLDVSAEKSRYSAPPPGSERSPEDGDLLGHWKYLYRNKFRILGCGLLLAILAGLYSWYQPPVFRAQTLLEFGSPSENSIDMKEFGLEGPMADSSTGSFIQTQAELLQDETLLSRVVSRLQMASRPEFQAVSGGVERLLRRLGARDPRPDTPAIRALQSAKNNAKIRPSAQARIVTVSYESTDPKFAADFVNAMADEFVQRSIEFRLKSAERLSAWLRQQLEQVREKLERSEEELQRYARASGVVFTQEKNSVAEAGLQAIQQELFQSRSDLAAKQAQFDVARSTRPEWLPHAMQDPGFQDSRNKLTELRRQLAELSSLLTPSNYKVMRVQAQIAAIESIQKNDLASLQKRIDNEYGIARSRESALSADYTRQSKAVADEAAKLIHYNTLKRDVESARELHSTLAKKVQDADIASALRTTNVHVIGEAMPPVYPFKPNVFFSICLGFLGGIVFGVLLVLMRTSDGNEKIRMPGEMVRLTGVRELASVPLARLLTRSGPARLLSALSLRNPPGVDLVTWENKSSVMAEVFREATASLVFSAPAGEGPQAIVVTSPGAMEGKSAMVSNLGIALAELGRRVLLIDGDLRRPTLHTVFGLKNESGLSDLLSANQRLTPSVVDHFITITSIPRLWVLSSGPSPSEITTLLHNGRFSELIEAARGEFDVILIDSPPILPVTDARFLARAADGALLVVRAGQTTRLDATQAAERLMGDHIPIVGTVLNGCDPKLRSLSCYAQYHSVAAS